MTYKQEALDRIKNAEQELEKAKKALENFDKKEPEAPAPAGSRGWVVNNREKPKGAIPENEIVWVQNANKFWGYTIGYNSFIKVCWRDVVRYRRTRVTQEDLDNGWKLVPWDWDKKECPGDHASFEFVNRQGTRGSNDCMRTDFRQTDLCHLTAYKKEPVLPEGFQKWDKNCGYGHPYHLDAYVEANSDWCSYKGKVKLFDWKDGDIKSFKLVDENLDWIDAKKFIAPPSNRKIICEFNDGSGFDRDDYKKTTVRKAINVVTWECVKRWAYVEG